MPVMTLILVRQVQVFGGRKTQMGEEKWKEQGRASHREWVGYSKPPAPALALHFPLLPLLSGSLNVPPQEPHLPASVHSLSALSVPSQQQCVYTRTYTIHCLLPSPLPPAFLVLVSEDSVHPVTQGETPYPSLSSCPLSLAVAKPCPVQLLVNPS